MFEPRKTVSVKEQEPCSKCEKVKSCEIEPTEECHRLYKEYQEEISATYRNRVNKICKAIQQTEDWKKTSDDERYLKEREPLEKLMEAAEKLHGRYRVDT